MADSLETTSAIDLVLSRIGEEFDGECHLSETEARQIADTITRLQAALTDVANWRKDCHAHDADMGHELRSFDDEDWEMLENFARRKASVGGE